MLYSKFLKDFIAKSDEVSLMIYPPTKYIDGYKNFYSPQTFQGLDIFSILRIPFINEEYKEKGSILFFGCSYTYGLGLNDDETIEYIIHNKTRRNAFNLGFCSAGIQHMLYMLNQKTLYEYIGHSFSEYNMNIQTPEFVIYTYIPNHLERLYTNIFPHPLSQNGKAILYGIKNGKLELKKPVLPAFFYKTYIVKSFLYNLDLKTLNNGNKQKDLELFNRILLESRKTIKEHYPDIKFVVLRYRMEEDGEEQELSSMWDTIKGEGFIVLDTQELIGRKFKLNSEDTMADGCHPSSKAWEMLAPKIIEELNL